MTNQLPVTTDVVRRIRALRHRHGMSAQALADLMTQHGYPVLRSAIALAENGRRHEISVDWLAAAAQALNVSITTLWHGPACLQCSDSPPGGYSCNACGREA